MHASKFAKVVGLALTTLLVAACDNGSDDPTPPPANKVLKIAVNDNPTSGKTQDRFFVKPDADKNAKSISLKVLIPTGSKFIGSMTGLVDGGWEVGAWTNITPGSTWLTWSHTFTGTVAADGVSSFGFMLSGGDNAVDCSTGCDFYVDDVVLTYQDDTTATWDFQDGNVPAVVGTKSDNSAATLTPSVVDAP
jgi:hypothetical protein